MHTSEISEFAALGPRRHNLLGLEFDHLDEHQLAANILESVGAGSGGWLLTPNLSIARRMRSGDLGWILESASEVVPDGQPLQWLAWAGNSQLGPRVTGADIFARVMESLPRDTGVLLIGGPDLAIEKAAARLTAQGVSVCGAQSPPHGFDATEPMLEAYCATVAASLARPPDLVAVCLSFPRQERVSRALRSHFPNAYFLNTGAAAAFWVGAHRRAPRVLQRAGFEWAFRLIQEPRRLARRYLLEDAPFLLRTWISLLVSRRLMRRDAT